MDREARLLGRSLVRSDDEDDDYDDDLMDLEASNIILTPLLRLLSLSMFLTFDKLHYLDPALLTCCQKCVCSRFRPMSLSTAAATPRIQTFQVRTYTVLQLYVENHHMLDFDGNFNV